MLIKDVKKLEPEERFWYWIKERYELGKKKERGKPAPWTDDEVLQSYFFTWPYRELDKTTIWFRENIRGPMSHMPEVLLATVIFRWFNKIETGQILMDHDLIMNWDSKTATHLLEEHRDKNDCSVFTGAYMIKAGNGPPGCKIGHVCKAIDNVKKCEEDLLEICVMENSMQSLWKELKTFPHLGGFMSYEIVCDLRYTYLLDTAKDINTWTNPGPGAMRGLARLHGIKPNKKLSVSTLPVSPLHEIQRLLEKSRKKLPKMPRFEMREIEHSLCEFDKYDRMLWNDGKSKRKYNGKGNK